MNENATTDRECAEAGTTNGGESGAAKAPRPTAPRPTDERQREASGGGGSLLIAPLRWLRRKLSDLVRWFGRLTHKPLRSLQRKPSHLVRWAVSNLLKPPEWIRPELSQLVRRAARRLPAPLRWLVSLIDPGRERGFGFWWLVATVAIAVALGLVVALLVSPVAALIALLVVAIWALVRMRRRPQDDSDNREPRAPPHVTEQRFDGNGGAAMAGPSAEVGA